MFQGKPALPSAGDTCASGRLFLFVLLAFIVATRWAMAPRFLYYFDSANFALSLDRFNPAMHQPQPPGYAMFVALIRIIHLWVASPERVLLIAGLLAACAAVLLIQRLAHDLFDRSAGILAAALLASNPCFWLAGITNQVRLFLAVAVLGVGILAWRAVQHPEQKCWFYGAFAALGLAGGFRPDAAVLLLPLLAWTWLRTGRSWGRLLSGCAAMAATALPWLTATIVAVGGPREFLHTIWDYSNTQFQGSSAIFGAALQPAYHMVAEAVVWNFLGVLAWCWALPMVRWRPWSPERTTRAKFLTLCFLPPFLFSAFVHIGDPDQALGSITALCLCGGGVLASVLRGRSSRVSVPALRVMAVAFAMIAVQTLIFFVPPGKLAKVASYRAAVMVDRMIAANLTAAQQLRSNGPVTLVHYGSLVSTRQLSYYFPNDYVVVLPGSPGHPAPSGESPQVFYRHQTLPVAEGAPPLAPGCHRVVCFPPYNARPGDLPGWRQSGPVFYLDRISGNPLTIGPYTLISEPLISVTK